MMPATKGSAYRAQIQQSITPKRRRLLPLAASVFEGLFRFFFARHGVEPDYRELAGRERHAGRAAAGREVREVLDAVLRLTIHVPLRDFPQ